MRLIDSSLGSSSNFASSIILFRISLATEAASSLYSTALRLGYLLLAFVVVTVFTTDDFRGSIGFLKLANEDLSNFDLLVSIGGSGLDGFDSTFISFALAACISDLLIPARISSSYSKSSKASSSSSPNRCFLVGLLKRLPPRTFLSKLRSF